MPGYDLVVLGDVNMDYLVRASLPFPFSSVRENGLICWEEIDEVPGGTGLNFCAFAAEDGYRGLIIGKVGSDPAGMAITGWLTARGVDVPERWTNARPTGKAIIMRDSSGVRMVINNSFNANHALTVADIDAHLAALQTCRMVYVSGYNISDPGSARQDATLRAMALAQAGAGSPAVVLDVVPHRIYEKLSFAQFREMTRQVDILISEIATMRRFLGLGSSSELIDDALAKDTAEQVAAHYPRAALRYGPSGCDHEILIDAEAGAFVQHATGHHEIADKRGYGDRLALAALRTFFHVLPAPVA